ncbi:MAG: RNA methyltransferase, partial [Muribaculum sp.]|nr:RNA methyltransferase [Muribaculum sp.]
EATRADMERMTHFSTAPDVIAVYRIQEHSVSPQQLCGHLSLALDRIQDPGNLGTIIRLADWFGIHDIVCSPDTVDLYNPKVVQATMGAIARVRVSYTPLPPILAAIRDAGGHIYGTFLDGTDIYSEPLSPHGIIVMGNEGSGISDAVAATVDRRLLIPSYPAGTPTVESLNVAIATAITVAEFRRQSL